MIHDDAVRHGRLHRATHPPARISFAYGGGQPHRSQTFRPPHILLPSSFPSCPPCAQPPWSRSESVMVFLTDPGVETPMDTSSTSTFIGEVPYSRIEAGSNGTQYKRSTVVRLCVSSCRAFSESICVGRTCRCICVFHGMGMARDYTSRLPGLSADIMAFSAGRVLCFP